MLLDCDEKIKQSIEVGCFAAYSKPINTKLAERLALEIEEYGYHTGIVPTGIQTEDGTPLVAVMMNWKWKPGQSHLQEYLKSTTK